MTALKEKLYTLCINLVKQRIADAKQAITDAEAAAEEETKSSAGDKYETSREMMQQEKDRSMLQMNEANKLLVVLQRISTKPNTSGKIEEGCVVTTNNGNFYLAVSAGTLTLDGKNYIAISAMSPIGAKMQGLKTGDEFSLNGKGYKVLGVE